MAQPVTESNLSNLLQAALEMLPFEPDPVVRYHAGRKLWFHLQRDRTPDAAARAYAAFHLGQPQP
jgi:hypothetical protein